MIVMYLGNKPCLGVELPISNHKIKILHFFVNLI